MQVLSPGEGASINSEKKKFLPLLSFFNEIAKCLAIKM